MTIKYFKLNSAREIVETDLLGWSAFVASNGAIQMDEISTGHFISTIFIGIHAPQGAYVNEIFFETMMFDDYGSHIVARTNSYSKAIEAHEIALNHLTRMAERAKSILDDQENLL